MNEKSPPRKLIRSRSDRYVGGVAAGIAGRLRVDPVFVRIGFLASLVLGGLGLIVYLMLLVLMPVEGDPSEPLPPIRPMRRNLMIGLVVFVGIISIAAVDSGHLGAWLLGFWPGALFGILLWGVAASAFIWLIATGQFKASRADDSPPASGSEPTPAMSTELVTRADSPSQLPPTETMEPRQSEAGTGSSAVVPGDDWIDRLTRRFNLLKGRFNLPKIGRIILWSAIAVAGLIVFGTLFVVSAGTTILFGGVPMAILVILLGGGMVFAALRGRRLISLWLLTAAVAVTLPMAVVSIADLRIEGSYGDLKENPLSMADVPDDGYRMAAGDMTIDLRGYDFGRASGPTASGAAGTPVPQLDLSARSGIGLTSIIVPDDVCVIGQIDGKAGIANFRGRQSNGLDVYQGSEMAGPPSSRRMIQIDAEFKLGAFEIIDDTQWRQSGRGGSFDLEAMGSQDLASTNARQRAVAACSAPVKPSSPAGKAKEKN